MKKVVALTICLCMAFGCLAPVSAEKEGAKGITASQTFTKQDLPAFLPMIRWDMSQEELKFAKFGTTPIVSGDKVEYYDVPLLDRLAGVTCVFSGEKYEHLDMVMVVLNEEEGADPLVGYGRLCDALVQQYGKPSRMSREWMNAADEKGMMRLQMVSQGDYLEYQYFEDLDFQLSCTLEEWDGNLVASVLFQRGSASEKVDIKSLANDQQAKPTTPVREFAISEPTPQPAEKAGSGSSAQQDVMEVWNDIDWGMNHDEVRAQKGPDATEDSENWLRYDAVLAGDHPASLSYYFENDALSRFYIIYKDVHDNKNDYPADYEAVSKTLADKLGEPTTGGREWKRYAYKDMPDQEGLAVSLGDLRISELWEKDGYSITHALAGEDSLITHYIEFSAPERSK